MFIKKYKQWVGEKKDLFKTPRTKSGQDINTAETLYSVAVFSALMMILSWLPPQAWIVHALVISVSIFALSRSGRNAAVPVFYSFMAGKLGWVPFDVAFKEESAAHKNESLACEVQPMQGERTQMAEEVIQVVDAFLSVPKEEKKKHLSKVVDFLRDKGFPLTEVDDGENEDEKALLATYALKRIKTGGNLSTTPA